jgi:P-type E1-E2 ATPase
VDDYRRFLADRKANERKYHALLGGVKVQVQSQAIRAGDIVFVTSDEEVPCDLLILNTSDEGNCFIQVI